MPGMTKKIFTVGGSEKKNLRSGWDISWSV